MQEQKDIDLVRWQAMHYCNGLLGWKKAVLCFKGCRKRLWCEEKGNPLFGTLDDDRSSLQEGTLLRSCHSSLSQ